MLFVSSVYLFLFLPACVAGYYALASWAGPRWAVGWLLAASLFFYGWWNPAFLGLIGLSVAGNYMVGGLLIAWPPGWRAQRRMLAAGGVIANLVVLGYFKYFNFFVENLNHLTGADVVVAKIILPLGISFFTFQQIAYLIDCYTSRVKPTGPVEFGLFVLFFPQLIAGPIVHHSEIVPQFRDRAIYRLQVENLAAGLLLILIGLFKKLVCADSFATLADPVFHAAAVDTAAPQFIFAWTAALAYTLQIYFDFSGYIDIAIGSARLFNIVLPDNFNSPYKAASIIDFWRCWHMTLSRFLRDYVYIPLGGNRKGPVRRFLNLFLTMVIGGLWHGAAWTFVLWGALHGAYLIVNHLWRMVPWPAWLGVALTGPLLRAAGRTATLLAVVVAWVFFRADSMAAALHMLTGMVTPQPFGDGANPSLVLQPVATALKALGGYSEAYAVWFTADYAGLMAVTLGLAACLWLPNSSSIIARLSARQLGVLQGGVLSAALGVAALATLFAAFRPTVSPFIYFNF